MVIFAIKLEGQSVRCFSFPEFNLIGKLLPRENSINQLALNEAFETSRFFFGVFKLKINDVVLTI